MGTLTIITQPHQDTNTAFLQNTTPLVDLGACHGTM